MVPEIPHSQDTALDEIIERLPDAERELDSGLK